MTQERNSDFPVRALIALGSNLPGPAGPPVAALRASLAALNAGAGGRMHLLRASRLYHTPCVPAGAGPDYVNAVALLATTLGPEGVLARLHAIEDGMGRERRLRWGARTLDLDLLDWNGAIRADLSIPSKLCDMSVNDGVPPAGAGLVLPHPRLHLRAFVLVPLAEIAPGWRHPVSGETAAALCAGLPAAERDAVVAING